MEEMLTLARLGVTGSLKRTLESTNPCESMIEIVRRTQRNVKRWSSGEMALRWTGAGMLEAERQFRKIIGYRDLATCATRSPELVRESDAVAREGFTHLIPFADRARAAARGPHRPRFDPHDPGILYDQMVGLLTP
jgi:hypothetical protein